LEAEHHESAVDDDHPESESKHHHCVHLLGPASIPFRSSHLFTNLATNTDFVSYLAESLKKSEALDGRSAELPAVIDRLRMSIARHTHFKTIAFEWNVKM
jgi:hypothetical protein